ncbi:sensor histidine kinase [Thiocystis violacea]|uniref:sensor histidine kinase n=1 Tax=Thiocystis violacea TaxID=13725 RepID=UPI0019052CAB|nr:ATP-binding protein [Thiocystis violacea]MBK1721636.1 sensor histidine kinase [Thiocystis violacea]
MDIKAKLKLIGLLPLIMAVLFGLTFYRGQDRLDVLRDSTLLAAEMLDELRQLEVLSRHIVETRANGGRRAGYQLLEDLDSQMLALQSAAREPNLVGMLDEMAGRLLLTRIHFMNLDGLSVPALGQLEPPPSWEVAERLRRSIAVLQPMARRLFRDSDAAALAYGRQLWMVEFWLLAATALLVMLLTYPTLRRVATAIQSLSRETRHVGEGGHPRDLVLSGEDEFAQLARDFNHMAHRLADAEQARERRARDLEEAVKDLENFSYSVSHDLRAPLRAIDGFIGILEEDYAASLDDEGRRLFGVVSANAKKMEQLIDDILALSRAGRLELDRIDFDMGRLVEEVWEDLSAQRAGRAVRFLCPRLPNVACDPRAIRQVWQNLLANAIKFTRGQDPAMIEVRAERRPGMVCYRLSDNGAGFDPAYSNKLFGLFLRLHGIDEFEGTGVGLAIVKRFIDKHQGRVEATGATGAGATFSFCLPTGPPKGSEEEFHGEQRLV